MIPVSELIRMIFFFFAEPTDQLQTTNNKNKNSTIFEFSFYFVRAIRTRTVDLLGKTDQTDYYQNDPNCFKDPTCIFFALGSFIN